MSATIKGVIGGVVIILALEGIHVFNTWVLDTFTLGQIKIGFCTFIIIACVVFAHGWHRVNKSLEDYYDI